MRQKMVYKHGYDASCADGAPVNNFLKRKRREAAYKLGRKTELSTTDGGTYYYDYDASSNMIHMSNTRLLNEGRKINYIYDGLNRLTEKRYEDKNGAPVVTKFHYGKPDSGNSSGRLVKTEDETGTVEVEYGSLGEIKKEVRVMKQHDVNGKDIEAVMEYTANYLGQMEKMKYPDGEEITYVYDDAGQICSVLGTDGDYVDDIGYDECGQRIYIRYSNGVETTYNYKKETRLLDAIKTTAKKGSLYQNIEYDFTKAGNIRSYTNDCLNGGDGNYRTTQSYEYDSLYQLTKVNGTTELNRHGFTHPELLSKYEQNFTFDKLGNMKTKKSSEVTVTGSKKGDDLNYEFDYEIEEGYAHRYSRIGNRYYKYDEVGNIVMEQDVPFSEDDTTYTKVEKLKDKVWGMDEGWGYFSDAPGSENSSAISRKKINRRTYEWNAENQLVETSDESLAVNYTYGADGKRASKYTHSSETLYFNDYWVWHIDSAVRSRGGKVTKNIYLGTERIASRIGSYNTYYGEERESTFFYHSDHLGSAQLVTDHSGNEYQRLEYTPYGETWMDLKAETSLIMKLPYKFSAKELDEETGLYYYGARYLDPRMSRWISADPAMNTGEYFPVAPTSDEAKRHNGNLPGMGGIFNHINFHLYHYAGNNPVRYTDPDGRNSGAPPEAIKRYEQIQQQRRDAAVAILTEKEPIDFCPYSVQKEISDKEYDAWQRSYWPPKRNEFHWTPFPKQNIEEHEKDRSSFKVTKLVKVDAVIDRGQLDVGFTGLKVGGEFDTPVFFGFYCDVLDNYIHYANNDKKGTDFKFSLASVSFVFFGLRTDDWTLRMSLEPNLGYGGNYHAGDGSFAISTDYYLTFFKNIPVLQYLNIEVTPNE